MKRRLAVCVAGFTALGTPPAMATADAVKAYLGAWTGKGELTFKNGKTERIDCRAYHTEKDETFRLALRCASPAYKIEIRSQLLVDGDVMTGTWEERTYNVSGNVAGKLDAQKISLQVDGGRMTGDMAIKRAGDDLEVDVATTGIDLTGVNVAMSRQPD